MYLDLITILVENALENNFDFTRQFEGNMIACNHTKNCFILLYFKCTDLKQE